MLLHIVFKAFVDSLEEVPPTDSDTWYGPFCPYGMGGAPIPTDDDCRMMVATNILPPGLADDRSCVRLWIGKEQLKRTSSHAIGIHCLLLIWGR